jgi:hypothetical protein
MHLFTNLPALDGWAWAYLTYGAYLLGLAVVIASRRDWRPEIRIATWGCGATLVIAWALSFDALNAWWRAASVDPHLTAAGSLLIDGEMGIGVITWVAMRNAPRGTRRYVAGVFVASMVVSVIANFGHPFTADSSHVLPPVLAYPSSAIPSLWAFLIVHQVVMIWRYLASAEPGVPEPTLPPPPPVPAPASSTGEVKVHDDISDEPFATAEAEQNGVPGKRNRRQQASLRTRNTEEGNRARAYQWIAKAEREGKKITGVEVGKAIDVSDSLGRRYLREFRAEQAEHVPEQQARLWLVQ